MEVFIKKLWLGSLGMSMMIELRRQKEGTFFLPSSLYKL